jgi:hypothetical protein
MEPIGLDKGNSINEAGVVVGELGDFGAVWVDGSTQELPTLGSPYDHEAYAVVSCEA